MHVIVESDTLESFLSYLDPLVDECRLHFEDDGMTACAVDPANVGMVDDTLAAEAFESYEVDGDLLGVNLNRLDELTSMADSGELIDLELDLETRKLNIRYGGFSSTLALIDPDSIREEPDIPSLDLPATIVLEGRTLNKGVKAADMVSDHITFAVDPDAETFTITAEGDTDDVSLTCEREDLISLTVGEANSIFSLDYIEDEAKPIDSDDEVTIELGEDFPVKFHLEYADGNGSVTYMTAPRIQSD